jgi:hypothetical protein
MSMGCGRGIHDGGVRVHPGSNYCATHGTGGKTDTRMAADSFDLSSIREGVDIQDAMLFRKPYRGLHWCPIPFETLQVKISLIHKGRKVVVMHGNALMRTPLACWLVTLYQECGYCLCSIRLLETSMAERIDTKAFVHQVALKMQTEDNVAAAWA